MFNTGWVNDCKWYWSSATFKFFQVCIWMWK